MPSGGYRPGAGRPRKNPIDAKLEGKPKAVPAAKKAAPAARPRELKTKPAAGNVMTDYFGEAMKECGTIVPSADALRGELEAWLEARGCTGIIAPQTISDYVLNRQGFLACEAMNRKIGRMTKDMKLSPYVTAGQAYYRAMQADFNIIQQAVNRHAEYQPEEQNAFLALLQNRGF